MKIKNNKIVLVNQQGKKTGLAQKELAHRGKGMLHRAVSVILYREVEGEKEILLQKRSKDKILWGGFWSNTVCTHPCSGEEYVECGVRRLREELGISLEEKDLEVLSSFVYQAKYDENWSEWEHDTILVGEYEGEIEFNRKEVEDVKWIDWKELKKEVRKDEGRYTPWLVKMVKEDMLKEILE